MKKESPPASTAIIQPGDPEFYPPEGLEALDGLYRELTPSREAVLQQGQDNMETFELGDEDDTRFNVMRFLPRDPDGSVIYVFSEFGWAETHTAGIIRALAMQRRANPNATLVLQLNDAHPQSNMNFTSTELQQLGEGDYEAYIKRINVVLEKIPGIDKDAPVTFVGLSQGGTVATKVAASGETPVKRMLIVEPPHVIDRSRASLGYDFIFSGKRAKEVIERNAYPTDDETVTIKQDLLDGLKMRIRGPMGAYALSIIGYPRTNLALGRSMARDTFESEMYEALDKRGVAGFHAWATEEKISPAPNNREFAARLGALGLNYCSFEISESDHSITNDNQLMPELLVRLHEQTSAA